MSDPSILGEVATVRVRAGAVHWEVRSAEVEKAIAGMLIDPEQAVRDKQSVIHESWLVTVARTTLPTLDGSWLLRRSNYAKPSARRRDFFRPASAVRAFRNGLILEQLGVRTPRVLAGGVLREWRVPKVGYLLTQEVPNAVSLAQLAQRPEGASVSAVKAAAKAIARLHQLGFVHGDLTINNVLLDGSGRAWFIDLERMRRVRGELNWNQVTEDFHRFARHYGKFTRAGKLGALRLLRIYCRERGWVGQEREFIAVLGKRLKKKIEADQAA